MFIYNVTVNIDDSVHDEWLDWMKNIHIKEVMATGLFVENRMLRVLGEEKTSGTSYAIQYTFNTLSDYETYQEKFAPMLQAKHAAKYKDKFVAFRTMLEVVKN